jgi:hypothetical protein
MVMWKRNALALGGWLLSAAWWIILAQEPPLPRSKEPVPEFALTSQHGPYLIYVASFRGEEAYEWAHALTHELREAYKLQAFIIRRVDQDAEAQRKRLLELQAERMGSDVPQGLRRVVRVPDEYAVLVGHYRDLPAAKEGVKKLKAMPAPKNTGGAPVAFWTRDKKVNKEPTLLDQPKFDKSIEGARNPFQHAFPLLNPLVSDQRRKEGTDRFQEMNWMKINEKEQFSLLTCPQPYTLVVKEFRSQLADQIRPKTDFDPNKKNNKPKFAGGRDAFTFLPPIMDQSEPALKFATKLREEGFQAYVLHLGETSYVTVGGYTGLRDPALRQNWVALKSKYGKEPYLQNTLPSLMPVPGRDAPPLGEPVK